MTRVDPGQRNNKSCYYHSFITYKAKVTNQLGQPGHTRVNVQIKIVIVMVLKLNLEVNWGQGLAHRL